MTYFSHNPYTGKPWDAGRPEGPTHTVLTFWHDDCYPAAYFDTVELANDAFDPSAGTTTHRHQRHGWAPIYGQAARGEAPHQCDVCGKPVA